MTNEELWRQMDAVADEKKSFEQPMKLMLLLKTAYDNNLNLIISCIYIQGASDKVNQGYIEAVGKRMLICYTSKEHAEREFRGGAWDIVSARDVINNMFNKPSIGGMVFNPEDEKMIIIIKELLEIIMPGEKPKPPDFKLEF